jgi:GTP diphosphokinase / guanosine-3',5'-bis(diphosphate) 3'-diphosphatase
MEESARNSPVQSSSEPVQSYDHFHMVEPSASGPESGASLRSLAENMLRTGSRELTYRMYPMLQRDFIDKLADRRRAKQPAINADSIRQMYLNGLHSPTVSALTDRLLANETSSNVDLVRRAYALALIAHDGQKRQSGEDYIDHPVAVATILLDLRLDDESVAAALLHDVVEDTGVPLEVIREFFGEQVAHMVDGVTKLSDLETKTKEELQAGSYRKLIIAAAEDPRVFLIKLADRLHNMRTLGATPPAKQERIARETLDIYAPLAHRLGMWQMKSELEDLAFKGIDPQKYKEIAHGLQLRKEARERVIARVIEKLSRTLANDGIKAKVYGRPKHIYSIWRKMERKKVPIDQIYDQLAVRVIIQEPEREKAVGMCYRVLGEVHALWMPVQGEFDDYIARPKESSYQSLHTTVLTPGGIPCEVQIRTQAMHEVAEHGIAAHWRYKEGFSRSSDENFENKMRWLRELISWRIELTDDKAFVDDLKSAFEERVFAISPKGKIIELPVGSTPVDFAYHIHSEVGNHCGGAKVNGRMVTLDYQLNNGEIVEIISTRSDRGPSRDWLSFVKSTSARNHIRRFFRRQAREENIAGGRELLERELKRLGLKASFEQIADLANQRSPDDLFAAIGTGDLAARTIAQQVLDLQAPPPAPEVPPPAAFHPVSKGNGVVIRGVGAVPHRLGGCCNPIVGEPIVGFVTRGRGVTVHRDTCYTIANERDRARLIEVSWGNEPQKGHPARLRIESWDRVGLWRDVSAIIADEGINIESIQQGTTKLGSGRAVLHVVVSVQSLAQLAPLLDKLGRIPNVIEARRETGRR